MLLLMRMRPLAGLSLLPAAARSGLNFHREHQSKIYLCFHFVMLTMIFNRVLCDTVASFRVHLSNKKGKYYLDSKFFSQIDFLSRSEEPETRPNVTINPAPERACGYLTESKLVTKHRLGKQMWPKSSSHFSRDRFPGGFCCVIHRELPNPFSQGN